MYRKTLDLNTDATIQRTNTILTKEINDAFKNNWSNNNGNMYNDINITHLATSPIFDLKTVSATDFTHRKIFLTGKCNMVADTDTFSLIFTNGFNDFLGEAIRPTLNPLDNMYHFCYIMEGWTQYFKIANINTSSNTISNLTINYTALK
tara:strand:- start:1072 stop:1518 length:447 start_codon:yes stop_codon:yes gene_type:complete